MSNNNLSSCNSPCPQLRNTPIRKIKKKKSEKYYFLTIISIYVTS